MRRDYYSVLGVSSAASSVHIRRAYQRLARQYSPDVNFWERAAAGLFDEIAEAYRVLSDPMARAVYDRRETRPDPDATRATEGPARRTGRRGDDLQVSVELSFSQAVSGLVADLPVDRLSPCRKCDASGARPGSAPVECAYCAGLGTVWSGQQPPRPESCPACDGSGARVLDACPACHGRGVASTRVVMPVSLPRGMDTGAQLRIEGEGHAGPFGGPRGDLVVIVRVHDDPDFTRKGDNVHREVAVGLVEAVLGTRATVPGVDGEVDLVVPPGTQSGQMIKVRGRGMPRLSGGGRGDLCVTVRVEIPRGLDARTQELFREIGRLLPPVARATSGRSGRP